MSSDRIPGSTAGLGRRFAAITVDWFIADLSVGLIPRITYGERSLATSVLFLLELILLTSLTGSSLGQKLFNLKVVDLESGGAVPLGRVALRSLLIVLVLPAVFTKEGRAYHEIICRTKVINA
jgi:uncharacterized RDD family membrane protein YckC